MTKCSKSFIRGHRSKPSLKRRVKRRWDGVKEQKIMHMYTAHGWEISAMT